MLNFLSVSVTDRHAWLCGLALWLVHQTGAFPLDGKNIIGIRTGDQFAVVFDTSSNCVHQVEYADVLPQWHVLQAGIMGTGSLTNVVDTGSVAGRSQRYYRVGTTKPWEPDPQRFAWIAAGTFTMGSSSTELDRASDEDPRAQVTISRGFWMSKYETTQEEYQSVMGSNPSFYKGDARRPVERVSWLDATAFCSKLTARELEAGRLPTGYAYRLPTEAEWEYACRAGSQTRFEYGDDPNYNLLDEYAWHDGITTHPVGLKRPNAWGLYDMHGNVFEWCSDWYGNYPGGTLTDPLGPKTGSARVIRGGGSLSTPRDLRSARRIARTPDWGGTVGIRLIVLPNQ
jgi:formylglycine-generating enzyme required for sulfatase activity